MIFALFFGIRQSFNCLIGLLCQQHLDVSNFFIFFFRQKNSAGFPLEWPESVQSLFAIQSTLSTAGQYMLRPDCELSHLDAAEAFYQKMSLYACFPFFVISMAVVFWVIFAKVRSKHCGFKSCWFPCCCTKCKHRRCDTRKFCTPGPISWRKRSDTDYSPKDKMVLTIVVLLYMLYPTLLTEIFSMLACRDVGRGRYLVADMQEPCYTGRHLLWVLFLCLPQMILYVVGIPLIAITFLKRNKKELETNRVVMFRYGLLYNGYNARRYYWEGMMAIRKASMVALRVFGSLSGVELQAHIGSALIVLFLVCHLAASPYDDIKHPGHRVLHNMDSIALLVCWLTLWGGLFYYHDNLWNSAKILLTIGLILGNVVFFLWASARLVQELIRENGVADALRNAVRKGENRRKSLFNSVRLKIERKSRGASIFNRVFRRPSGPLNVDIDNPLNSRPAKHLDRSTKDLLTFTNTLTKKSSSADLRKMSQQLEQAKLQKKAEMEELHKKELQVRSMAKHARHVEQRNGGIEPSFKYPEIKIEMISRSERREQIEKKKKSLNMLRNSIKGDAISRLEKKKKRPSATKKTEKQSSATEKKTRSSAIL